MRSISSDKLSTISSDEHHGFSQNLESKSSNRVACTQCDSADLFDIANDLPMGLFFLMCSCCNIKCE